VAAIWGIGVRVDFSNMFRLTERIKNEGSPKVDSQKREGRQPGEAGGIGESILSGFRGNFDA